MRCSAGSRPITGPTRPPGERVTAIRSLQQVAPEEVVRLFGVEEDGSFTLDVARFLAVPA